MRIADWLDLPDEVEFVQEATGAELHVPVAPTVELPVGLPGRHRRWRFHVLIAPSTYRGRHARLDWA